VLPAGRTGVVLWDSQLGELRLQVIRSKRDVTGLRQRSPVTSRFDARPDGAVPGSDGRRVGRSCAIQPRAVPLKIALTFINISAITPFTFSVYIEEFQYKGAHHGLRSMLRTTSISRPCWSCWSAPGGLMCGCTSK